MPSTIAAEKQALRKSVKEFYLSGFDRLESDRRLLRRFLALPQLAQCRRLLLFYGVGFEPDTARLLSPLAELGKELALPCCLPDGRMEARRYWGPDRLSPGPFGIPQPDDSCPVVEKDELELILVPNLCCDRRGYRLGRGGGYYDRYLAGCSAWKIALCRDKLLFSRLPIQPHDQPLDLILTENQCLSPFDAEKKRGIAPLLM